VLMRILFNQMATLQPKTGVGHYANQLRQHLAQRPDCRLTVYPTDGWLRWTRRLRYCFEFVENLPAQLRSQNGTCKVTASAVERGSRRGAQAWARQRYRALVVYAQPKA